MTYSSHKAVAIVTLETQPLFSDCNCYAFSDIHGLCRQKLYTTENLYNSIYRRLRPLGIVRKQYASFRAILFIVYWLNNSQRRSALHYKKRLHVQCFSTLVSRIVHHAVLTFSPYRNCRKPQHVQDARCCSVPLTQY